MHPFARSTSGWTALKRANDVRVRRAKLKRTKDGRVRIQPSSARRPSSSKRQRVIDILMAVPKFGRVKAARFLKHMPHQPVEDRRRLVRTTAHGAD